MLIQCPECELPISERAISCPHCGYPMKTTLTTNTNDKRRPYDKKANRRRRLPNGFGQISEIKNRNLRNPFRAMITVGKTETGRPICKPLKPVSFFETYNDAYSALVAYNKNPYDVESGISLQTIYERWSEKYYEDCSKIMLAQSKRAWKKCSELYDMAIAEIKVVHIKHCMDNVQAVKDTAKAKATCQKEMRALLNKLFDYAIEYGILERNIMRDVKLGKEFNVSIKSVEKGHMSFTEDELNILWSHTDQETVRLILLNCYSGWRPAELCELDRDKIDFEQNIMVGGKKTAAGKNRTVPIHPKIREFVEEYKLNQHLTYYMYRESFIRAMHSLGLNTEHTPHDCRKTFITLAKKYHVDEYAIKRIVGHEITDITENIYTERGNDWLMTEISKIM